MKPLFLILGFLFTGIGFLGIFVPGLPATMPLILAAFFFSRSSKRFHTWLINNKFMGPYIRKLVEKKGLDMKSKRRSILAMWIAISLSIIFIPPLWLKIFVGALGVIGTFFILFWLKTIPQEIPAPIEDTSP